MCVCVCVCACSSLVYHCHVRLLCSTCIVLLSLPPSHPPYLPHSYLILQYTYMYTHTHTHTHNSHTHIHIHTHMHTHILPNMRILIDIYSYIHTHTVKLAEYDLVVTTFETLASDLTRSDPTPQQSVTMEDGTICKYSLM